MKRFLSLVCSLALVAAVHAGHFLPANAVDAAKLLPPAPAPDSLVQKSELNVLLQIQKARTPEHVSRAQAVQNETFFDFASEAIGPWFTQENLPLTAALFKEVGEDSFAINRSTKSLWNRPRPPFADSRIQACVTFSNTPSYPSGHAIQCSLWAALLIELLPEYSHALQETAADSRWYRLVAGAHFPTDIEAGRILGEAIARAFLKNDEFLKRFEKVRAELAPFLQKKAA